MMFGVIDNFGPVDPNAHRLTWGESYRYGSRDWMITYPPQGLVLFSRDLIPVPSPEGYKPTTNSFEIVFTFANRVWPATLLLDSLHPHPVAVITGLFIQAWQGYWR